MFNSKRSMVWNVKTTSAGMRARNPLPVIRDDRVSHRTTPASHEQFFLAVRMEQHQVCSGLHCDRLGKVCIIPFMDLVSGAPRSDVDNVVVIFDGRIRRDVRRIDVKHLFEQRLVLGLDHPWKNRLAKPGEQIKSNPTSHREPPRAWRNTAPEQGFALTVNCRVRFGNHCLRTTENTPDYMQISADSTTPAVRLHFTFVEHPISSPPHEAETVSSLLMTFFPLDK